MRDVVDGVELFPVPLGGGRSSQEEVASDVWVVESSGSVSRCEKGNACVGISARKLSWMVLSWEQEVRGKMQSGSALGAAKWPVGDFEEGALRLSKERKSRMAFAPDQVVRPCPR